MKENAIFEILGIHKKSGNKEILDTTGDKWEAEIMVEDFKASFGRAWSIKLISHHKLA